MPERARRGDADHTGKRVARARCLGREDVFDTGDRRRTFQRELFSEMRHPDAARAAVEQAHLRVSAIEADGPTGLSAIQVEIPDIDGLELEVTGSGQTKAVTATARRWGRDSIRARIDVIARHDQPQSAATGGE